MDKHEFDAAGETTNYRFELFPHYPHFRYRRADGTGDFPPSRSFAETHLAQEAFRLAEREREERRRADSLHTQQSESMALIEALRERERKLREGIVKAIARLERPGTLHLYRSEIHAKDCGACALLVALRALLKEE